MIMSMDGRWLPRLQPAAIFAGRSTERRSWIARRQDELLDEALKETFPASDPVSTGRIA